MSRPNALLGARRSLLVVFLLVAGLLAGYGAQPTAAQPAPMVVDTLCASLWTGEVTYHHSGCPAGLYALDLTAGEITLCWNPYTGQVRYPATGVCTGATYPLTIGGQALTPLCASLYTGNVSYAPAGACPSGSISVMSPLFEASCTTSGDCPQPISEYYGIGGIDEVLVVNGASGSITDVNVTVNLLAEDLSDVNLSLMSPEGTEVALLDDDGCQGVEHLQVVFDDEGAVLACGALTGSNAYQPVGSLAAFDGEDANGNWTLTVETFGITGNDAGVLVSWGLTITTTETGADVACTTCMVVYPNELTDPNGGATLSSLTVSPIGDFQIGDVNVTVDIGHTFVGDLHLFVVGPDATVVRLIDQRCGGSDDLEVVFDDEAGSGLACPSRLGFNSFLPAQALSAFDGASVAGDWHLVVLDDNLPDQGALNNWSLTFTLN